MEKQFSDEVLVISELDAADADQKLMHNYKEYVTALAGPSLSFFEKYPQKLWGIPIEELSAKFAPRRIQIRKEQIPFHAGVGKWAGVIDGGCGRMAEILEAELNKLGVFVEYRSELTNLEVASAVKSSSQRITRMEFNEKTLVDVDGESTVIMTTPLTKICEILGIENKLWYRCLKIVAHVIDRKIVFQDNYDWLYFDSDDLLMHRLTLRQFS